METNELWCLGTMANVTDLPEQAMRTYANGCVSVIDDEMRCCTFSALGRD